MASEENKSGCGPSAIAMEQASDYVKKLRQFAEERARKDAEEQEGRATDAETAMADPEAEASKTSAFGKTHPVPVWVEGTG